MFYHVKNVVYSRIRQKDVEKNHKRCIIILVNYTDRSIAKELKNATIQECLLTPVPRAFGLFHRDRYFMHTLDAPLMVEKKTY